MAEQYHGAQTANQTAMSRLENDVETLKRFVSRIQSIEARILRHAKTLGYYQESPPSTQGILGSPLQGVPTIAYNMQDVLMELDRGIDSVSGCLNVFD